MRVKDDKTSKAQNVGLGASTRNKRGRSAITRQNPTWRVLSLPLSSTKKNNNIQESAEEEAKVIDS